MPKACKTLLDQVLCHINLDKVLTKEWLHSGDSVDSACADVRYHFKELTYLRGEGFKKALTRTQGWKILSAEPVAVG